MGRIAVVTTSYPSAPGDPSGAFVREDALLHARRSAVHVLCPAPASPSTSGASSLVDPRVVVHALEAGDAFGWPGALTRLKQRPDRVLGVLQFVVAARRRLCRLAPDLIRAHWLLPSAAICADLGRPLEVICHGSDLRLFARLPAQVRLRFAERLTAARLQLMDAGQAELLRASLPAELAASLLAGSWVEPCPLPPLEPAAPPPGMPAAYVAVVARLIASKRIPLAIDACRRAGIDCVVVGDGPVELTHAPGLHPVGYRSHPETLGIIAGAQLLLHTSAAEGSPTVVREARALGVPVLACASGDLLTRAATDPGIELVEPEPEAIAAALRRRR